jgi:hypothetical protein
MSTSLTPSLDGPHCADCSVGRLLHDTAAGRAFAFGAVLLVSVFAVGCSFQNQLAPSGAPATSPPGANADGTLPADAALVPPPVSNPFNKYRVKVTFDSMTVHDKHEGIFSGDGEYDIAVYVQGTKIDLTDASGPGDGLWDISDEETVTFRPGTEITVDLSPPTPLVIFTVGSEVDPCGRTDFYKSTWKWLFGPAAHGPTMLDNVKRIQDDLNYHSQFGWHESGPTCKHDDGLNYPLNKNDIVGVITKIYDPPGYGAGVHSNVVSSTGDFTLRYTIVVTPPPVIQPARRRRTSARSRVSSC